MDFLTRSTYHSVDDGNSDTQVELRATSRPERPYKPLASSTSSQLVTHEPISNSDLKDTRKRKCLSGWRTGALLAACGAIFSLLGNLVAVIWISSYGTLITSVYLSASSSQRVGLYQLFEGQCDKVQSLTLWSHLLVNAVSTLLLSGSNYCMQCLCAPTREEVDTAHSQGRFLDIGVLSLHNLKSIARYKYVLWIVLVTTSIPLHLLYNSAFYSVVSTHDYAVYLVTSESDFLSKPLPGYGGFPVVVPFLHYSTEVDDRDRYASTSNPEQLRLADSWVNITTSIQTDIKSSDRFERLENADCIKAYAEVLNPTRRNLVVVTANTTADANTSILAIANYQWSYYAAPIQKWFSPYLWICSDPLITSKIEIPPESIRTGQRAKDDNVQIDSMCFTYVSLVEDKADEWAPLGYKSEYCLSEKMPETCTFMANTSIMVVVIFCNAIKVGIMLFVAFKLGGQPLMTIGDAIDSFLRRPDHTTRGRCLLSKKDVTVRNSTNWRKAETPSSRDEVYTAPPSVSFRQNRLRYYDIGGRSRWIWTTFSTGAAALIVAICLARAVAAVKEKNAKPWEIGLGDVDVQAIINGWAIDSISSPNLQITAAVLAANSPQLILSSIYFGINGLLTVIWLSKEWTAFATTRKTLRVSDPKGAQRSKHFLQLPYRIAVPLIIASGLLHWLVSQSIFLTTVKESDLDGTVRHPVAVASCGFSPVAIAIVLTIASIVSFALIVTAMWRYTSIMPLADSCSLAISAACHPPAWDTSAALLPVQWGAIPSDQRQEEVGHCCFTSGPVEMPLDGKLYEGLSTNR